MFFLFSCPAFYIIMDIICRTSAESTIQGISFFMNLCKRCLYKCS